MKLSITGVTAERDNINLEDIKIFSGKNAGICYGSHGYFGTAVTDPVKALERFERVAPTGHHSVTGHTKVTVLFEEIPKIGAMVLNSLGEYVTSEKSGRYTRMTGNSELEKELYDKWVIIFEKRIKEVENLDDALINKLAMENARYLLSVFTPTTMSYTTSIYQFNYIIDWCDRLHDMLASYEIEDNYFNRELVKCMDSIADSLKDRLYIHELRDNKNRQFDFLAVQTDSIWADKQEEQLGMTYLVNYKASFVQLAQAQRHRTLDYFMQFNGESKEFFIPYMIKETAYEQEWLKDINMLSHVIPQGTLVDVVETGTIPNLLLKCTERLCGRAQIEVMNQTRETLKRVYNSNINSEKIKREIEKYCPNGEPASKCNILGGCKEVCRHGSKKYANRLI